MFYLLHAKHIANRSNVYTLYGAPSSSGTPGWYTYEDQTSIYWTSSPLANSTNFKHISGFSKSYSWIFGYPENITVLATFDTLEAYFEYIDAHPELLI